MLLRLLFFRLTPMLLLKFCKDRNRIRLAGGILAVSYGICFAAVLLELLKQEGWKGWFCLPFSMFPHYLCYGMAVWMIFRCLWYAWSVRVWKRIYVISLSFVILGILMENYWNPPILEFVMKNLL